MLAILPPLRDPATGEPFAALPCMAHPDLWDVDAPTADHRAAVRACRSCPALQPCADRAVILGRHAEGVWAGKIRPRDKTHLSSSLDDDPLLARWARSAGVTMRPQTSPPPHGDHE